MFDANTLKELYHLFSSANSKFKSEKMISKSIILSHIPFSRLWQIVRENAKRPNIKKTIKSQNKS